MGKKNPDNEYAGPVKRSQKARDGTQEQEYLEPEVNKYGTSDKPIEEYIDDGVRRSEPEGASLSPASQAEKEKSTDSQTRTERFRS